MGEPSGSETDRQVIKLILTREEYNTRGVDKENCNSSNYPVSKQSPQSPCWPLITLSRGCKPKMRIRPKVINPTPRELLCNQLKRVAK